MTSGRFLINPKCYELLNSGYLCDMWLLSMAPHNTENRKTGFSTPWDSWKLHSIITGEANSAISSQQTRCFRSAVLLVVPRIFERMVEWVAESLVIRNRLPVQVQEADTLHAFKIRLETPLLRKRLVIPQLQQLVYDHTAAIPWCRLTSIVI